MVDYARRLEGTVRNVGTHAAGVVIADRPLARPRPAPEAPQQGQGQGGRQHPVGDGRRREGRPAEDGLPRPAEPHEPRRRRASSSSRSAASRSTCFDLPLDDEATYKLLQRGEAKGLFQLDGAGIRDLLVKMKPDRFADLIAILALYRPGPLNGGMVDEYVDVKHGRKQAELPAPGHEGRPGRDLRRDGLPGTGDADPQPPRRDRALAGVRVHQGDLARRRPRSSRRAASSSSRGPSSAGWRRSRPTKIFDLIEFFGGYGFNKSHTTAYALVAFQTAYLKAHYPTEFMAALLSSEMDGAEREKFFVEHIEDCRRMGIEVLPPEHQRGGGRRSSVAAEGKIHFGLAAIKGVGFKAVEAIVEARKKGGPFARPRRPLRASAARRRSARPASRR